MTVSGRDQGGRTLRIQWVRSGIGFDRHQREVVRSLGLRRLHQVVERPDTPQIRGMVAMIPHLVRVVSDPTPAGRIEILEYSCFPPEPAAIPPAVTGTPKVSVESPAPGEIPEEQELPPAASESEPAKAVAEAPQQAKPAKAKKTEKPEKKKASKETAAKEKRGGAGKTAKSPKASKK